MAGSPETKTIEVTIDHPVKVEVSLDAFKNDELVDELERREVLTEGEAHCLRSNISLEDHYDKSDEQPSYAEIYEADLEFVGALVQRRDLAEALVQLGRLHPALAELHHLYARRAGA